MMTTMTDTPESPTGAPPPAPREKPSRLYQAAAWVVIVSGVVFTASVIFFSGAMLTHRDHHRDHHHHHGPAPCMMKHQDHKDRNDRGPGPSDTQDRKSTRLNSSHVAI